MTDIRGNTSSLFLFTNKVIKRYFLPYSSSRTLCGCVRAQGSLEARRGSPQECTARFWNSSVTPDIWWPTLELHSALQTLSLHLLLQRASPHVNSIPSVTVSLRGSEGTKNTGARLSAVSQRC